MYVYASVKEYVHVALSVPHVHVHMNLHVKVIGT